jgi:Ca-activated chloride channel family protein
MRSLATLFLVVALAAAGLAAQTTTFRAQVDVVRVDALVTDGGHPVIGLGSGDFELLDNGVPQHVDLISSNETPVNLVLALDMSDSVNGNGLSELRTAGRQAVAALRTGDKAGLVTFSGAVSVRSALTADASRIGAALDEATASGDTAVRDASYAAMVMAESDASRALVMIFSDGIDTASVLTNDTVMTTAKRLDAVVYALTVADPAGTTFLRDLSSQTGGRVIRVQSTKNLGAELVAILDEFRHRYVLSYTPQGVSSTGWHRLDVRLKGRHGTVNARPGYVAAAGPGD